MYVKNTSQAVVPALKTHMGFFFRASLTRGIVFKIPGTVSRLPRGRYLAFPGVNGDVTYVKRRAIAAGILA